MRLASLPSKESGHFAGPWRALTLIAFFLTSAPAFAQSSPSLKNYAGNWVGSGTLSHENGQTERIRCQVGYALRTSSTLQQTLDCKSDNTSFELVSSIADQGGRLSGDWLEKTRNAHGAFVGVLSQAGIQGNVQGTGFAAAIAIGLRGNKQTIAINSRGGDIKDLRLVLARSSAR